MMAMSVPYESSGRTSQKRRTRDALVAAVRDLLAEGQTPQVDQAAERAGISRTTAYRYFPNQRMLLMAAHPQISPDSLLPDDAPTEPRARLDAFMAAFTAYNLRWEAQLRTSLRLSLEPAAPAQTLRQGRAIRWIEDALSPLDGTIDIAELAVAIRSATGIETLIWLIDVAGRTREEAGQIVAATARALLDAALADQRR
jgi:AcrR family transcriptional regulator